MRRAGAPLGVIAIVRRIAVVLAVLAVTTTTAVGVRADGHQELEIILDLVEKEKGKPNKVSYDLLALYDEYQAYIAI